jgi:CRP-like cAMP-binding protein
MVLKAGDLFGESALVEGEEPPPNPPAPNTPKPAEPPPGEHTLHGKGVRNSTAVALTDGTVLALDRKTFRALLETHPTVAARVIEQLVRRLRDAEDQIEIMMLRDTQSKIVSALLKLAGANAGGAGATTEIMVSPVELSVRVGLDIETVKRGVQRLRDQQYVRIVGERIEIPELEALRRLYVLLGTKDELKGS